MFTCGSPLPLQELTHPPDGAVAIEVVVKHEDIAGRVAAEEALVEHLPPAEGAAHHVPCQLE